MIPPARPRYDIRISLPASLEALEQFFREFRERCACLADRSDRFAAELLLREAMTNAVLHGCEGDPARQVRCVLRMKPGRLVFRVADDGEGFDWRTAWDLEAAASACSGRGLEIFRKYATRVRFNSKGNAATILRRFT